MMLRSIRTPTRRPPGMRAEPRSQATNRTDLAHRSGRFLDHIGRVGAEHHHLAMRHVDDTHLAEGDGKSDSREQEDRAEAYAEYQSSARQPTAPDAVRSRLTPAFAAARTAGEASAGTERSSAAASSSPRSLKVCTAAIRSASGASGMARRREARAPASSRRAVMSVSRDRAVSTSAVRRFRGI